MTGAADMFGRGIAFPPRIGPDGGVAMSDGLQNVRESIQLILLTEPHQRLMLPQFGSGLRSFLHQPNTPATRRLIQQRITQALQRWERRIEIESVDVEQDPESPSRALATIRYRLVANQSQEQLSVGIDLNG